MDEKQREYSKNLFLCKIQMEQKARVFVPGKPFQPCIMFAGKASGLPWRLLCSGRLLALLTSISLSLERFAKNTLAYLAFSKVTKKKSFSNRQQKMKVIFLFYFSTT